MTSSEQTPIVLTADVAGSVSQIAAKLPEISRKLNQKKKLTLTLSADLLTSKNEIDRQLKTLQASLQSRNRQLEIPAVLQLDTPKLETELLSIRRSLDSVRESVGQLSSHMGGGFGGDGLAGLLGMLDGADKYEPLILSLAEAMGAMAREVIEADAAMTDLKQTGAGISGEAYDQFLSSAVNRARDLGAALPEVIRAATDFSRLGYTLADAEQLTGAAILYKNISDSIDDMGDSAQRLSAVLQAFGLGAEASIAVVDKLTASENNFAFSSGDAGKALSLSADALAGAGNSLEQSIGLAAAMSEAISDPELAGSALETLALRLTNSAADLTAMGRNASGAASSVVQLQQQMKKLSGVDIALDTGDFKSTWQILSELSQVWDSLSEKQRTAVASLAAGAGQQSMFNSLMTGMATGAQAAEAALNSEGAALRQNAGYLSSMEGRLSSLNASFQSLSQTAIDSDTLKSAVSALTALFDVMDRLVSVTGLLPPLAAAAYAAFHKKLNIGLFSADGNQLKLLGQTTISVQALGSALRGGLSQAVHKAAGAITNMSAATKAMLLNMGAAALATAAISAVVKGIQYLAASSERAIEKGKELKDAFEESGETYENNAAALKNLREEFSQLSRGVDDYGKNIGLTADQYDRYNEIVKEIVDMYPSLITGRTAEGRALVDNNNLIQNAIDLQNELNQARLSEHYNPASAKAMVKNYDAQVGELNKGQNEAVFQMQSIFGNARALGGMETPRAAFLRQEFDLTTTPMGNAYSFEDLKKIAAQQKEIVAMARERLTLSDEETQSLADQLSILSIQYNQIKSVYQEQADYLSGYAAFNGLTEGMSGTALTSFNEQLMDIAVNSAGSSEIAIASMRQLSAEILSLQNSSAKQIEFTYTWNGQTNSKELSFSEIGFEIESLKKSLSTGDISGEEFNAALSAILSSVEAFADSLEAKSPQLAAFLKNIADNWRNFADTISRSGTYETLSGAISGAVDAYASSLTQIESIQSKVANGASLSYDEYSNILSLYPELANASKRTSTGWTIEAGALFNLKKQAKETAVAYLKTQLDMTKTAASSAAKRLGINFFEISSMGEFYKALLKDRGGFMMSGQLYTEEEREAIREADLYFSLAEVIKKRQAEIESMSSGTVGGGRAASGTSSPVKSAAEKQLELFQKESEKLKYLREMDLIDAETYYYRLALAQKQYLTKNGAVIKKLQKEYQDVTLEIHRGAAELYQQRLDSSEAWISQRNLKNDWNQALAEQEAMDEAAYDLAKARKARSDAQADENSDLYRASLEAEKKYQSALLAFIQAGGDNEIAARRRILAYTEETFRKGAISHEEYIAKCREQNDRIYELEQQHMENAVSQRLDLYKNQQKSIQSLIDLTVELIKHEKEEEISRLKEKITDYKNLIAAQKESLHLTERELDYQDQVGSYVDEIAALQKQADLLALDDSRGSQAKRADLLDQISEKQKELNQFQHDDAVDKAEEALDAEYAAFESEKQKEIKTLETYLSNSGNLVQAAMARIDAMGDALYQELVNWNLVYGDGITQTVTSAWESAHSALQDYQSTLEAVTRLQSGIADLEDYQSSGSGSISGIRRSEASIVSEMKRNGDAWSKSTSQKERDALHKANEELMEELRSIYPYINYDNNTGRYYKDKGKTEPLYHSGLARGFVGNTSTPEQNEVYALLEKGELVLNREDQLRLGNALKFFRVAKEFAQGQKPLSSQTVTAGGPAISIHVDAPVEIHGGADSSTVKELQKFGDTLAENTLSKAVDLFTKRGFARNPALNALKP